MLPALRRRPAELRACSTATEEVEKLNTAVAVVTLVASSAAAVVSMGAAGIQAGAEAAAAAAVRSSVVEAWADMGEECQAVATQAASSETLTEFQPPERTSRRRRPGHPEDKGFGLPELRRRNSCADELAGTQST